MGTNTVSRPGARPAKQAPGGPRQQGPVIPFPRAARQKSMGAFAVPTSILGAAPINLGPIEISPSGYLRYIELQVTGTTAGNAANVAFAADGPFSVIQFINTQNAAGDTIMVPMTGYQLYTLNKWGALAEDPPFCDPRSPDAGFSAVTGAGGTGGSFSFSVRIPFEVDPVDAFCALPNMAGNRSYQIQLQLAPLASLYTTNPTNPPTVTITATMEYWSQPNAVNGAGAQQAQAPAGVGSVGLFRLQTIPLTAGDKLIQLTNVGNVIRWAGFTLRDNTGARTDTQQPALHQIILNNDVQDYYPDGKWTADMATAYGYNTTASKDVAGGLDTGTRVWFKMLAVNGRVACHGSRNQWLPTLDATLLQYRGTSFGATAATLEVITHEIKPISAAALYGMGM